MWYTVEERERPSGGSEKKKRQKMPKKNGFCIFMEERRNSVLAAGHEIPGGKRDLAQLLNEDWKALSQEERNKYCEKAKQLNERVQRAKSNPSQARGKVQQPLTNPANFVTSDEMPPEHKIEMEESRASVFKIFRSEDWASHPIVICHFTLYNELEYYHDMHIPAEIGLSTMSLNNGVIDNYARIIDMKTIPTGRNLEFAQMAKKLGIPAPGTVPEFADYQPVMMILESFLKKYQSRQDELHVFALDSDFGVVRHCLDWLYDNSGTRLPVKILSLDLYAFLASSSEARALVNDSSFDYKNRISLVTRKESEIIATTSRFRQLGQPLNETFVYPLNLPMTAFGIFLKEEEVEVSVKKMDNYKFFEELCCVYHIKSGQEVQNCALSISNRYAFSLLEILTMSNEIPIKAGYHYPRVSVPNLEKMRRTVCIQRWGISNWEKQMEMYNPDEYAEASGSIAKDDLKKKQKKKWNRRDDPPDQNAQPTSFQPKSKSQGIGKQNYDDESQRGIYDEDGAVDYSGPMSEDIVGGSVGERQQPQISGRSFGGANSSSPIVALSSAELNESVDPDERYAYKYGGKVPSLFLGR